MIKKLKKSHLAAILAVSLLTLNFSAGAGRPDPKLTIVNNTDYKATLEIHAASEGGPGGKIPSVVAPHTKLPISQAFSLVGYITKGVGGNSSWDKDPIRKATLSLFKDGAWISKDFTFSSTNNQRVFWIVDEKTKSGFSIDVKADVELNNYTSIPSDTNEKARVYGANYTITIDKEPKELTKIKKPREETNPQVDEALIDYSDVFVNFKNSTKDKKLKVDLIGQSGQSSELAAGSQSQLRLKSKDNFIPIKIFVDDLKTPAIFDENVNTIGKTIKETIPSQAVVEQPGKPGYILKLKVTPRYIETFGKEKPWRVEYNIDIGE